MYNYVSHITHSSTLEKLVDQYNQQCQDFMDSKTVNQFKALFPALATPSKLLAEKSELSALSSHTRVDLKKLVDLFGIPDKELVYVQPYQQGTATVYVALQPCACMCSRLCIWFCCLCIICSQIAGCWGLTT